jgi:pimeloyl-ACP methyl ester carboxylesterase/DNA-binding winged helix-turn-helix (wHTH) protein
VNSPAPLAFAEYRLDPASGQLYRGAEPVPLPPKAFALLQYLAARPGRLISKHELLDQVWPGVYVTDAVLKTTIKDVRRALGDDSHSPRFIQTAHRRGYRFLGKAPIDPAPTVRYARGHDGVNIAYQVVGTGPRDIVFVMGWVSHLEYFWNEPSFARFLRRLAANARLILFDKRGTGLSDPVPVSELPSLEQRLQDVRAVMHAASSERAVLMGVSEGGPLCSLFAATYPQRTEALVMIGSYARRMYDTDYPWGATREERDEFCRTIIEEWGGPVGIHERAPSRANDPAFRQWWASYLRMGASPGAAVALTRMNAEIDVRSVLPTIRVPTLVVHRAGDRCLRVDEGRFLAANIRGAEYAELPGEDHLPFVGDQDALLDAVERFLADRREVAPDDSVLASILTIRADRYLPDDCDGEIVRHRGQMVARAASQMIAAFDGPARSVTCAAAVIELARRTGITARGGVHVGPCDPIRVKGPVFEISAALAAAAAEGTVVVSRTVVDLVPGSGLRFADGGAVRAAGSEFSSSVLALHDDDVA